VRRWAERPGSRLVYNEGMGSSGPAQSRGEGRQGESDSRYRELLDSLALTVFEFDLQGRLTFVNQAGFARFGYTEEDLASGLSVLDMVVAEERDHLRANIMRRLASGDAEGYPYRARRRDGTTFPTLVHASVVTRAGRPDGMRGYLVDITERVRMEDALRRRMEFERLIMTISTRLVSASEPHGLDAHINEALADIGRFLEVDRSYVFLFSPDGALMDNTHEWVSNGATTERANLQRIPAEGVFPWFTRRLREQHAVVVPDVAALPAEAAGERAEFEREGIRSLICVAMLHDGRLGGFLGLDAVSRPRGWSEEEVSLLRVVGEILMGAIVRRRAELALQGSERKYRALVETTATGFVITDAAGHVLDGNAEYVRMTGHRSLSEILGRALVEWTAPHDRARNAEAVRLCVERGFIRNLQVDYVHADGTVVPLLINATVTEVEGQLQIVSIIRDMTERIRLEAELLRSEKLRSVGVLAGGIAHDFNNILTAILGNVSLLQAILRADTGAGEHLDEIERATQRARELTRQLLTFSRGGEPVRKIFPPEALVRESATLALRGRASACEFRIAPGLPLVNADEGQIGQVVRNLVLNASQAMNGGGVVVVEVEDRVLSDNEVQVLPAGVYIVVTVRDTGAGIPDEILPRIFDPYFTTKSEGRGLGLAVSHSIVAGHAGAIVVQSQVGQGTAFTVYLPATIGGEAASRTPPPGIVKGRGRVLVMDDEASVRQVVGKMLSLLGYEAAFARDGREALDVWQQACLAGCPFDLAIMDLTVPGGMGGREAMRGLLALDPSAKGVVSSGYSDDPVMASFRDYGFADVLAKPYRVADLSRVLAALLGA
jgi:PAS domain S-box-containing protein